MYENHCQNVFEGRKDAIEYVLRLTQNPIVYLVFYNYYLWTCILFLHSCIVATLYKKKGYMYNQHY